jgi:VanZ family protein
MRKITTVLLLIWMGFIFYNSATPGTASNNRSNEIVNSIINSKNLIEGKSTQKSNLTSFNYKLQKLNYFLRKNAHALEYLTLAMLVEFFFSSFNLKGKNIIIYIMFICLLYAVLDEFHQSFVPGRTSLVSDVLIDFSGSMLGIILYFPLVSVTAKLFKNNNVYK